ncbi:MAG TPA: hypothetical protein VMY41_14235, partial [Thermohalobaculum sp.]|nr:hypothetical protein [Thermohalobaculum sp.]
MMANLRSLLLLAILAATTTALALRIQDQLQRPIEHPDDVALEAAASDQKIEIPELPQYEPPPIERFAAAFDRPLFNPDRRPSAEEPVAAGVVEVQALSATLQGILFA